jgi:hypothetical protein
MNIRESSCNRNGVVSAWGYKNINRPWKSNEAYKNQGILLSVNDSQLRFLY